MSIPGFTAESSLKLSVADYIGTVGKTRPIDVWMMRDILGKWRCKARCAACNAGCAAIIETGPAAAACFATCAATVCDC